LPARPAKHITGQILAIDGGGIAVTQGGFSLRGPTSRAHHEVSCSHSVCAQGRLRKMNAGSSANRCKRTR
jgi:hypothetical protein